MIPQISIQQNFAQIGISRRPMDWQITSQPADLNLHQVAAKLEISRSPAKLTIDQQDAFNQEGLMDPLTLLKDTAEKAREAAAEGTAETARLGDQFIHIEKGGTSFLDWVNRYQNNRIETNIGLVPLPNSVHIQFEPSRLDIQAQPGGVQLNPMIHQPDVHFTSGDVNTYIQKYQSISITPPPLPGQILDSRG